MNDSHFDGKLESWRSGSLRGDASKPRVLFGSVYEDAAVEERAWRWRLDELENREPRAFCIASGGDTLFSLLLPERGRVDGVDVNPAQIWLCQLKIAARQTLAVGEFTRATTGDARPFYARLRPQLNADAQNFWDQNRESLKHGLNGCGFVDGVMRRASRGLRWLLGRRAMRALLNAPNVSSQRQLWETRANRRRFRALFCVALHPLLLRAFYGAALREGLPLDLGAIVRANLERALVELPIASNPYIAQLLRGRLNANPARWPLALQPENFKATNARLSHLRLHCAEAASWLDNQEAASIDFFGLSNVPEAVAPESARRLFEAVARAAAPGALVCVRSITGAPVSNIEGLIEDARLETLKNQDRSPFCRLSALLRRQK